MRNIMVTVTFKIQDTILKKIDSCLMPLHFGNRTEFIREAIRHRLKEIDDERFLKQLRQLKGSANVQVSDKQLEKTREKVFLELAKERGIKLD